jgi:ATP-dependent DNA ligase
VEGKVDSGVPSKAGENEICTMILSCGTGMLTLTCPTINDDECTTFTLRTRNGKDVRAKKGEEGFVGRLTRALSAARLPEGLVLDGEMYAHGVPFQEVTRRFKNDEKDLTYCVYDLYDTHRPQLSMTERLDALKNVIAAHHQNDDPIIRVVETFTSNHRDDILALHARLCGEGYEGVMVRNSSAPYEPGKRSYDLLKYKEFQTDEFEIVDVVEAEGGDAGTAVFVCRSIKDQTFNVRLKACREDRKAIWEKASTFIGKRLTVRFQEYTMGGIPRFPIGLAVRDYEG